MLLLDPTSPGASRGKREVSGSDRDQTKVTDELAKAGAKIFIGHARENIPADCDLVIYTVAIPADNPEFMEAKKREIKMLTYPQTLNLISKEKYTIAISGTHGKTTVTAMIAKIMIDNGLDPTVIVGSLLKDIAGAKTDSNFVAGKSKYLVVEADEYKKSFHNLEPSILVINNIDADHLDFYKDLADIQNSFLELAQRVPKDGFLICNTKLPNLQPVIKGVKPARPSGAGGCQVVDYNEMVLKKKLLIPGEHNRQNAKAAMALASVLGINNNKSELSLEKFTGTWRRFEYKGKTAKGALVYDDYAHNPQKVKAALQGARELYPHEKIVVVFQPHLFSRTKLLLNEFATAFNDADEVMLTPIFPAREPFDPSISSEILAEKIRKNNRNVNAYQSFELIEKHLKTHLQPGNILITMGAGEQYKIGENLL
jgi:UDP-N-acetylmuramate--alanine ligase